METNPVNPQENPAKGDELLAKAQANKGKLAGALIFCIVVVVAALAWFFINQSGNKKAAELAGKADVEMNDRIAMQLYQQAAEATRTATAQTSKWLSATTARKNTKKPSPTSTTHP